MADMPRWRGVLEYVLSIGSYPGEPETRGGGRRVVVVAIIVATVLTIPTTLADLNAGYRWVAAINLFLVAVTPIALVAIKLRPHRFAGIVTTIFVVVFVIQLIETEMMTYLIISKRDASDTGDPKSGVRSAGWSSLGACGRARRRASLCLDAAGEAGGAAQVVPGRVDAQRPRRLPATLRWLKASTTKAARTRPRPGSWTPASQQRGVIRGTNCPGSVEAPWLAGWATDPGSGG
jgi:hypothetical protein